MAKQAITIRVEEETLAYFKAKGDKYQTEINEILNEKAQKQQPEYIAQLIYTKLKKAKNKFSELKNILNDYNDDIDNEKFDFSSWDICKANLLLFKLFPDIAFDDENVDFNRDNYYYVLNYLLLLDMLGNLIADDLHGSLKLDEDQNNFPVLLAYLKINYVQFKAYIYGELCTFIETFNREEMDEAFRLWDENSEMFRIWGKNNFTTLTSDQMNLSWSEIYNRFSALVGINSYQLLSDKNKKNEDRICEYIYSIVNYLSILYTKQYNILMNEHNKSIEDVFPDEFTFAIMVSDQIKSVKLDNGDINKELIWLRYLGYGGDLNIFELNTKHKPRKFFDEYGDLMFSDEYYNENLYEVNGFDELEAADSDLYCVFGNNLPHKLSDPSIYSKWIDKQNNQFNAQVEKQSIIGNECSAALHKLIKLNDVDQFIAEESKEFDTAIEEHYGERNNNFQEKLRLSHLMQTLMVLSNYIDNKELNNKVANKINQLYEKIQLIEFEDESTKH